MKSVIKLSNYVCLFFRVQRGNTIKNVVLPSILHTFERKILGKSWFSDMNRPKMVPGEKHLILKFWINKMMGKR